MQNKQQCVKYMGSSGIKIPQATKMHGLKNPADKKNYRPYKFFVSWVFQNFHFCGLRNFCSTIKFQMYLHTYFFEKLFKLFGQVNIHEFPPFSVWQLYGPPSCVLILNSWFRATDFSMGHQNFGKFAKIKRTLRNYVILMEIVKFEQMSLTFSHESE